MELMSPLLLCALATLFPQALGFKSSYSSEAKAKPILSHNGIEIPMSKTVWLKRRTPSEVTLDMVLDYLSHSVSCSRCMGCMNKAINYLSNPKTTETSTGPPSKHVLTRDMLLNDILENYHQYKTVRQRRDTENKISTKTKRSHVSKSKNVTVTKYNIDGQVYAIKLKEKNSTDTENPLGLSTCHVYSVKKYQPCESPEAESITSGRKKSSRRSKKQAKTTQPPTTEKPPQASTASRDKPLAESFMTSIEELY